MSNAPQEINVLYNEQAMAILNDACERLKALGLHCGYGPDSLFPGSDMSAILHVSTSADAMDECIAGSILARFYANSTEGRARFDDVLSKFRADRATVEAMHVAGDATT